jgi:uncharacterized protein
MIDEEGAKSLAVMQGWIDALMSGNGVAKQADFWHSDAVVSLPTSLPFGGDYPLSEVSKYHHALRDLIDGRPSPPQLYGAGDKVFLMGRLTGSARKSGLPIDVPMIEIFTIRDGKIARDDFYFHDTAEFIAAVS